MASQSSNLKIDLSNLPPGCLQPRTHSEARIIAGTIADVLPAQPSTLTFSLYWRAIKPGCPRQPLERFLCSRKTSRRLGNFGRVVGSEGSSAFFRQEFAA